jgi:hypothetical protein
MGQNGKPDLDAATLAAHGQLAMQQLLNQAAGQRYIDHRNVMQAAVNLLESIDLPMIITVTAARLRQIEEGGGDAADIAIEKMALVVARSLLSAQQSCRRAHDAAAARAASGIETPAGGAEGEGGRIVLL